jgi:hypothetical protein
MGGTESLLGTIAGTVAAIALVLGLLGLAGIVVLLARQQKLLGQYQQLMAGTSAANLESALKEHIGHIRETGARVEALDQMAQNLDEAGRRSLRHLGLVRFNPFRDTGGDQSFAIVLADSHGDGIVISSLHSRDTTRVYAKPLQSWASSHSLTAEEEQAILGAQQPSA